MSLITNHKPRWNIIFRAKNIRHVVDGSLLGREYSANDAASAILMFKMSMYQHCEFIKCEQIFENRFGYDNQNTDVSKPKLIK